MTARFFRRPYPGANTVLLMGARPILVDPGLGSDVPALVAWLGAQGLRAGDLALVVNTHWHVDHAGANHALQALGVPIAAEAGEAARVNARDPDACRAVWLRQAIEPYSVTRALAPGEVLDTRERRWTVLALPGHSVAQIGLWDPCGRVLVAGDALHDADLGWLDLDEDAGALESAAATLDRIAALVPGVVLSGHGKAIDDPPAALARARRRVAGWGRDPRGIAWHACKRIFVHALMLEGGLARDAVTPFLLGCPWFHAQARRGFGIGGAAFVPMLLDEVLRAGAARWVGDRLVPCTAYTPVPPGWPAGPATPAAWPACPGCG